ncbi:hypothetical protein A0H81_05202 [Grifola frondosa]|uniref:Uncharacterized protein n=1 Tax=Grifola frondosa TaxID=5627 RepID=A0A1C7MCZ5_GRIFR|nr:hypothetical protein A0H81_05202 [Grifola frondosa]
MQPHSRPEDLARVYCAKEGIVPPIPLKEQECAWRPAVARVQVAFSPRVVGLVLAIRERNERS